jgi:cold-inducible RNA-binding protein
MKLFVAGLPYDLYDDELIEIFEKFGRIASAKVALDKETGKSRGFAFVEMPNDEEAREAIEHLNDISLGKKPLVVKQADDRSSGPGDSRGGGDTRGGDSRGGGGFGAGDSRGGAPRTGGDFRGGGGQPGNSGEFKNGPGKPRGNSKGSRRLY